MTSRLNFIADPELSPVSGLLQDRLNDWVTGLDIDGFSALLDPLVIGELKRCFSDVNGSEGTLWLADSEEDNLVAIYNSGPNSDALIGFEQPLGKGIISMVYSHERPYCENEIAKEARDSNSHDDTLDKKLGLATTSMIAVPFYFAFGLRGVLSCVQLESQADTTGFDSSHVDTIARSSAVAERLIDGRLITAALGLEDV